MTLYLGYSQLRLANGGEDKLHLNDMIISDAASCNQGQGTQREICREVLYAWIDRQSEKQCFYLSFISLSGKAGSETLREIEVIVRYKQEKDDN